MIEHENNGGTTTFTRDIVQCFPFAQIRPKQRDLLIRVQQALAEGKKVFVLELPTGFGKSPVASALGRFMGSSYVGTGTKDLQKQYERDFRWMLTGKGKSNFECAERVRKGDVNSEDGIMCDKAPCVLDDGYKCTLKPKMEDYIAQDANTDNERVMYSPIDEAVDGGKPCAYFDQKYKAFASSHSVFNYDFLLTNALYGRGIPKRALLICDEAHELQDKLTEFQGINLVHRNVNKFFEEEIVLPAEHEYNLEKWVQVMYDLESRLDNYLRNCKEAIDEGRQTKYYNPRMKVEATEMRDKIRTVLVSIEQGSKWVVSSFVAMKDMPSKLAKVSLKPLDVRPIARKLFENADVLVFMSATILGKDAFCNTLGLPIDEVEFISMESDFPVENRPIYAVTDLGSLSFKTEQQLLPAFAGMVEEIMTKHKGQKGIIHVSKKAHIYAIRNALSTANARRLMWTSTEDEFVNREQLIEEFRNRKDDAVLISPSLHTGLDLKDDMSRFQIIFKVLYPDMTDRVIAARKEQSEQWYNWKTALKVVQAYGRSVRHQKDWATTYVLDANFAGFFLWKCGAMLPNWFVSAIRKKSKNDLPSIPVVPHGLQA